MAKAAQKLDPLLLTFPWEVRAPSWSQLSSPNPALSYKAITFMFSGALCELPVVGIQRTEVTAVKPQERLPLLSATDVANVSYCIQLVPERIIRAGE